MNYPYRDIDGFVEITAKVYIYCNWPVWNLSETTNWWNYYWKLYWWITGPTREVRVEMWDNWGTWFSLQSGQPVLWWPPENQGFKLCQLQWTLLVIQVRSSCIRQILLMHSWSEPRHAFTSFAYNAKISRKVSNLVTLWSRAFISFNNIKGKERAYLCVQVLVEERPEMNSQMVFLDPREWLSLLP